MARQGKLVLPTSEDAVEFAAVVVERPVQEPPTVKAISRAEIVLGPVTVRLEEGASAARIAAVATRWRRHDLSIEPRPGHGGDQAGGFPQEPRRLAALVKNELDKDPFTGTVFVFRSRKADRFKPICWDGSGIALAYRRLEEHTFTWLDSREGLMTFGHARFEALFAGLDWRRVRAVKGNRCSAPTLSPSH